MCVVVFMSSVCVCVCVCVCVHMHVFSGATFHIQMIKLLRLSTCLSPAPCVATTESCRHSA